MQSVPVHQAKDRFSALLQAVEAGAEVVITRHGRRIARLVHEPEALLDADAQERELDRMVARLRAFQAAAKPMVPGQTDWQTLRNAGRR